MEPAFHFGNRLYFQLQLAALAH